MTIDGFMQRALATPAINNHLQGRLYEDALPRGYELPAAAIHTYDGSQDYDMAGPVDAREDGIQFDVYAKTSAECRAIVEAIRAAFADFTGQLPDGTIVELVQVQRAMAMPYLANADVTNTARRHLIGFHVVSKT